MPVYSAFTPSILGMSTQAHSLATISQNIANVSSGGYKRTETRFQTVLSDSMSSGQDFGGVRPKDIQIIDQQGVVTPTSRDLDLAIVGDGFFVLSDAVSGGNTFYSRDGSFDMKVQTATTGTGQSTSVPGHLVDKNGLYLMGWAPDSNGVFPTSGTLQAMRIDPDYFANVFKTTTTVDVGLNLPATATETPAVAQVNAITFAGTIEAGDIYSITVNGTTKTYTTTGAEAGINAVRDNLLSQINGASLGVTARATGTGSLNLTANTAGTAFTASASATNGGGAADNTASNTTSIANITAQSAHATAVTNAIAGNPPAGYYSYSISVVDSAGVRQPVQLNFTRSADNTWLVSATHSQTPTAQVDTVTLGGSVEPGDSYTVTVAGTPYTYTRSGATTTINTARDALISLINAGTNVPVTAAAGATGVITLTAKTAGSSFTSSASASNVTSTANNTAIVATTTAAAPAVAQVNDVTIAGTIEAGDVYSIVVNGTTFSYELTATDTLNTARDALIALVNADTALPVTASANGAGVVRLTADVVNTPFTNTASATNVGGGAANTASVATTTANGAKNTTTSATTLNFTNAGYAGTQSGSTLTKPNPISYSLTFNGGSTASFSLKVDSMTQFASGFLPSRQDVDGFEKSNLTSLSWDSQGYLIGHFTNDNSRKLYQAPLANFVSPNNLHMKSGMVFEETTESGTASVKGVSASERASFVPSAVELSNVDIAEEFSRMIMTQAAYNASSVSFRTVDEMTMTARDLSKA